MAKSLDSMYQNTLYNDAWTHINRNPFARADLMRKRDKSAGKCAWCGQQAKWRYQWQADGSGWTTRSAWDDGKRFCCVDCFRIYYGE